MKNEDFKKEIDSITEKIGKEKASLVADSFAKLISDNLQTNESIKKKDETITSLNTDKENLMKTNMNLLQQIPMAEEIKNTDRIKKQENNTPKASAFDFKEVFDENGNFKN